MNPRTLALAAVTLLVITGCTSTARVPVSSIPNDRPGGTITPRETVVATKPIQCRAATAAERGLIAPGPEAGRMVAVDLDDTWRVLAWSVRAPGGGSVMTSVITNGKRYNWTGDGWDGSYGGTLPLTFAGGPEALEAARECALS